jgi:hypothetical protein
MPRLPLPTPGTTMTDSQTAAYDNDVTTAANVNGSWGDTGTFPSFGTYAGSRFARGLVSPLSPLDRPSHFMSPRAHQAP